MDIDTIGRSHAEGSVQLQIAFENQYLRTIRKTVSLEESELEKMIEGRVAGIRKKLVGEIQKLYSQKEDQSR